MKKLYLLLFVVLLGCGSKAPKCEEDDTVETVKEIMFEVYQGDVHYNIMSELYGTDFTNNASSLLAPSNESMLNKSQEIRNYIKMYIDADIKSIPNEVLDLIVENHKKFIITNIRTNSIDETSKSCECSATFKIDNEVELNYTTQRNSDGEIYVEVER
ncbi:MAG: hypothetical protein IE931_07215 [Sphingobacteriales bacterium]|nr:hypothetical protein [Sphingobacteriales bacterium]